MIILTTSLCGSTVSSKVLSSLKRSARRELLEFLPAHPLTILALVVKVLVAKMGFAINGSDHDIKNLFISDGSQFTTGAAANPTLTIVALAIRQADYIADEIRKGNL